MRNIKDPAEIRPFTEVSAKTDAAKRYDWMRKKAQARTTDREVITSPLHNHLVSCNAVFSNAIYRKGITENEREELKEIRVNVNTRDGVFSGDDQK